jgi:hypothetical protein
MPHSHHVNVFPDTHRSCCTETADISGLIFSSSFPQSVDCSHKLYLSACTTHKIHKDQGDHRSHNHQFTTWSPKTSSYPSTQFFAVFVLALPCIKYLYNFSSLVSWLKKDQCQVTFGIYCFMKNMGPTILCTLHAHQASNFKSHNENLWTTWRSSVLQYLLIWLFI